jgi:hypothetical protein
MEPVKRIHAASAAPRGSALILAVVLTSLLAIVGVLFVMATRLDKMASSATTDNRELTFAVDAVLAELNQALVQDVPGIGQNQEYYDFPDANNAWLASSEPYRVQVGTDAAGKPTYEYYWRQISNLAGQSTAGTRDVHIRLVGEREPIRLDDPNANADADGEGVADARWLEVPGVRSGKGKPLYVAVRVLDNGGMLNVNTGYKFDAAAGDPSKIDGSSQLQVNVLALAAPPGTTPAAGKDADLLKARAINKTVTDLQAYERQVLWRYPDQVLVPDPCDPYLPFDLSDELELRYRDLLNGESIDTRLENWGGQWRASSLSVPVGLPSPATLAARYPGLSLADAQKKEQAALLADWYERVHDVNGVLTPRYSYRPRATTYNADRILTPRELTLETGANPRKMVNINRANESTLQTAIEAALLDATPGADPRGVRNQALQVLANLVDYLDDDDEVTVISGGSSLWYGFERPCIYISEIACRQWKDGAGGVHTSYAVELYKPYFEDRDPNAQDWKLVINNDKEVPIQWSGSRRFHVVLADDPAPEASLKSHVLFSDTAEPADATPRFGYNPSDYQKVAQNVGSVISQAWDVISLERRVRAPDRPWLQVDSVRLPANCIVADGVARSLQRDISPNKCVRRLWSPDISTPGLGNAILNYEDKKRPEIIQAHPANRPLTNIGELGMVFADNAYSLPEGVTAADSLIDLCNPEYRKLLNYLTVIDPALHPGAGANETRIMGRININTAPAFVLAQLPWMQYYANPTTPFLQRASAIVAYREAHGAFQSTSDLMQVPEMWTLALPPDANDNQFIGGKGNGPDLTPDTARDDMEERDLIFTRISNLVTVRSDVFTAYILVRIGTDGPQKRIVAILDRSQVNSTRDRVRLVAWHPVPDPR